MWANQDPHEGRLENAVEQAAFANDWVVDADIDITAEEAPSGNLLLAKMKDKERQITELKQRIEEENLSESKEADLKEELQTEKSLQYYLFEKGLSDPSVDAEEFSDLNLIGEKIELEPEEVEETQEAWKRSPLTRKTLPAIVDIQHEPESQIDGTVGDEKEEQGSENLDVSEVEE